MQAQQPVGVSLWSAEDVARLEQFQAETLPIAMWGARYCRVVPPRVTDVGRFHARRRQRLERLLDRMRDEQDARLANGLPLAKGAGRCS